MDNIFFNLTAHFSLHDGKNNLREFLFTILNHKYVIIICDYLKMTITCRWPGASLTIIRGHKNLHECAFIGDDSSEELEELLEVAKEQGLLDIKGTTEVCLSFFEK